jgi:hypothetical protein
MVARVEQSAVPGAHAPYGRATSIMGALDDNHADCPQATGQVSAAAGVPVGSSSKRDVGPSSGEGDRHASGTSLAGAPASGPEFADVLLPLHETSWATTTVRMNTVVSLRMPPMVVPRIHSLRVHQVPFPVSGVTDIKVLGLRQLFRLTTPAERSRLGFLAVGAGPTKNPRDGFLQVACLACTLPGHGLCPAMGKPRGCERDSRSW